MINKKPRKGVMCAMIKMVVCISLIFIILLSTVGGQGNTAKDWIRKGNALFSSESYQEAKECFDNAISLNQSSSEAWYGKGFALNGLAYNTKYNTNNHNEAKVLFKEAIKCFEKAIQLNSSNVEAYSDMADSENQLDNYEKALELADKALEINPNYVYAINVRGTVYYNTSRYEDALADFRKASVIDPNCGEAWLNICRILREQETGNPAAQAEASDACNRSAAIDNANIAH